MGRIWSWNRQEGWRLGEAIEVGDSAIETEEGLTPGLLQGKIINIILGPVPVLVAAEETTGAVVLAQTRGRGLTPLVPGVDPGIATIEESTGGPDQDHK